MPPGRRDVGRLGRAAQGRRQASAQVAYAAARAGVQAEVRQLQDRLHKGLPPLDSQRTVGDFLTYWVSELLPGTVSDSTLQGYAHIVRRDLNPYLGHVVLSRLGPEQVFATQQQLKARGLSPRTVTYARAVPRRALCTAERWDLVHRNAAALGDPPRSHKREPEHLSQAQVTTLLAAARDDPRGALYVMAVTTGMRQGELLALQWSEVDIEAAVVHVRATLVRITGRGMVRGAPKTVSSRRSVPLPAMTVAHLRRHRTAQRQAHLAAGVGWARTTSSSRRGAVLRSTRATSRGSGTPSPTHPASGACASTPCATPPRPSCSPQASRSLSSADARAQWPGDHRRHLRDRRAPAAARRRRRDAAGAGRVLRLTGTSQSTR